MGGLGPGIGGGEWFVIGLVALLVVGPERLPGLLRQLGKLVAKARGMANEFRASFDEMARQSELDDLRKEVEALRTGQGAYSSPVQLGAEANAAFKDIQSDLNKPLFSATPAAATPAQADTPTATTEWPDGEPVMLPIAEPSLVEPHIVAAGPAKTTRVKAIPKTNAPKTTAKKTPPAKSVSAKPAASPRGAAAKSAKPAAAKPKTPRAAPRKAKLDL